MILAVNSQSRQQACQEMPFCHPLFHFPFWMKATVGHNYGNPKKIIILGSSFRPKFQYSVTCIYFTLKSFFPDYQDQTAPEKMWHSVFTFRNMYVNYYHCIAGNDVNNVLWNIIHREKKFLLEIQNLLCTLCSPFHWESKYFPDLSRIS